jgi:hypothetical protein
MFVPYGQKTVKFGNLTANQSGVVIVVVVIVIIIIIIISFMQGIHTYIPETNHVPKEYSVADIL